MNAQPEQLWASLHEAGVVEGPLPASGNPESPWYVKVLLAFSGWLASLLLFGFVAVGMASILDSSTASFITGGLLIGAAFAVLNTEKNEFIEHLGLALSLAGQALVIWAIFEATGHNEKNIWWQIGLVQVPLAIVMPNFIHRVFSSYFSAFAFSMALLAIDAPYVISGVLAVMVAGLWFNEFRFVRYMRMMHAIGYGLVLAMIQLKGSALFYGGFIGWRDTAKPVELLTQPWMGEAITGAVLLAVIWQLLHRHGRQPSARLLGMTMLGSLLLSAASLEAQGMTAGILVMLLGFAAGNRVLKGLGIVAMLFYISSYYYLLDVSLLAKSQTLLIVGLLLLTARWVMRRTLSSEAGAGHA